ncbi:MAG: hypothetical protein HY841_04605 [Bacteroidetes bacterium]|nr:hypothetical protein [Bacteroidota bacterium]
MKNKNQNQKNKSLTGTHEGFVGIHKGLVDCHKRVVDTRQTLAEYHKGLAGSHQRQVDSHETFVGCHQALVEHHQMNGKAKNARIIILPIILVARIEQDYIPGPDGDFDEWQKNYVTHLSSGWMGEPSLYKLLGIPEDRYKELTEMQKKWDKDYARGGKEADRRSSEAKAKQKTRKNYEALLRSVAGEYIHKNRKADDEIKRALKLTVPDTEPTPVHGTDAPVVALKNAGGSVIAFRCRRDEDQTRSSMIKGYLLEVRSWALDKTESVPNDPDVTGYKEDLSSKSHFKIKLGMANLGKTFYCYVRWRSKTNSAFDSPWTNRLQIVIA